MPGMKQNLQYLFILLFSMGLCSCVNYHGIHGNSQKLDAHHLATSHSYKSSLGLAKTSPQRWWTQFHNPDLNELIAVALQDSPNMQMAEARIRQAKHQAEEMGASLWPDVDMSGYVQRERFSNLGLVPPPFNGHTYNISELGLNFNYELDFWGKNREALKSAMNLEQASEAEFAEATLMISTAVATTYFQLCNNIEQVRLAQTQWEIDNKILQIAIDRSHHGVSYAIPVNALNTTIQKDKQMLEQYRQEEVQSRHQLAVLLGKNPLNTDIQTRKFEFHEYAISLPDSLPAHLLAARPDIYAARWRVEAAAHQINVAKARFFPDLNLNALLSYQKIGFNDLLNAGNRNNFMTAAIDLPIFDANARKANLGKKYAEYDLAVNEYNQSILTALREVSDQLSLLKKVKSRVASQTISVQATQKNYQLSQQRFHHGVADYADVLTRKNLFLKQQADLINLQTLQTQTIITIYKALGGQDGRRQG